MAKRDTDIIFILPLFEVCLLIDLKKIVQCVKIWHLLREVFDIFDFINFPWIVHML